MKIKDVLCKDKQLDKLIKQIGDEPLSRINNNGKVFDHLINAILSQQLSTKVAKVIAERFWNKIGNKKQKIDTIINLDIEELRLCGLSYQKGNYVKNIANFWKEHNIKDKDFEAMADDEILKKLTQIKGVGNWTAEMVLMFCLGREDVFSHDDYGIQVAMKKIYKLESSGKELKEAMIKKSSKWKPYRTYACMYLWAFKDA
ncbi:MAG: DNA-3-methyladenine glycosylase 2 family protein [Saprospiraceae bacterium]|jgi:DNA-3-methyladenine glycosylase II|nr:DNA-3-methyladenine glycosylase 2 family protein [Saprospiraceae bacterium]